MRQSLSSLLESYTASIKQETLALTNEGSFRDNFVHIMDKVQSDGMITKDLVLQLMQLFYSNNQLFLQMFETSFLLIFKTYSNEGARFNRYQSQPIIDKYSQLLKQFLMEMIKMELQVQKPTGEQQYFENFVDFYLAFFAQGLTSSKAFIKEFSFKILKVSFKIIDDVLDVELLPETQRQLTQSCVYLLISSFDDYKMMGVNLYGILRKIKIVSSEVQEFLFQIIESASNYELRKATILQGISLNTSQKIDRLLNRLRDKNPLIKQTVIQKFINEKVLFQGLEYDQKMKILIDGLGSYHIKVRHKAIQFVGESLGRLKLFNSDHFIKENQSNLTFVFESISLICLNISPSLVKEQIKAIVHKISDLTITRQESAFLLSFLRQLSTQRQNQEVKDIQSNKLILKKFITLADFLPSFPLVLDKIKKTLRQEKSWEHIEKFANILKTLQLLIQKFDITDCAGKKLFYEQVRKFIIEFEYADEKIEHAIDGFDKQQLLESELRKLNGLLSGKNSSKSSILPVITHPLDFLSLSVEIFLHYSQENSLTDSILELKMHITQLLNSKQLDLEHEITTKMLMSACMEISKSEMEGWETKQLMHLMSIKSELEKKLLGNKLKAHKNKINAFTILARVLSYQQNHHHKVLIKASQYFEHIKRYLYHHEDESNNNFCYNYLPYILVYQYCKESEQHYKSFKKLFQYYAFEQDKAVLKSNTKSLLTKLFNLRLLTQLELFCEGELVQLIQMLTCFGKESQDASQIENVFYWELLLMIFNSSMNIMKNNIHFTMLMLASLSQHQISIRQVLITLQNLSISNSNHIFESLLITYECLSMHFYKSTEDPKSKSKVNSFMTEISRVFLNFFKVTANPSIKNCSQQNQQNKILFWRLAKMMKMLEMLLEKSQSFQVISIFKFKAMFPCLYELFSNKQFHQNTFVIQQLVFIKNKLQRLLELCKSKQKLENFQKLESYLLFISDIDQLNDRVEDEISKTHEEISFTLIETFDVNLNKEAKQQFLEIKSIIDHIKKTNLFQRILQIWEQSDSRKPKNLITPEVLEAIDENPLSITQKISELFDRRGIRKNKTLSKRMNVEFFQAKASVKKNRYLIIPYEVVQKVESSSKRMKSYQNTLKRKKNILEKIDLFAISSKN